MSFKISKLLYIPDKVYFMMNNKHFNNLGVSIIECLAQDFGLATMGFDMGVTRCLQKVTGKTGIWHA